MRGKRKEIAYSVNEKGCHICTSHPISSTGYCNIRANGKTQNVHRYLYIQKNGEIPLGLVIRHKCDNRLCINTDHMELGTKGDNNRDRVVRERSLTGEKSPLSKLKNSQVIEIYTSELKGWEFAKKYGVAESTIGMIRTGRNWSSITKTIKI